MTKILSLRPGVAVLGKRLSRSGFIALALLALTSLAGLAFAAGSARYGGPEELYYRVRSEFVPRSEHPQFVPAPFTGAHPPETQRAPHTGRRPGPSCRRSR